MNESSSNSNENTAEYWQKKYKTLENEFNEFCQSSGDLEHELNLEIDQLTSTKNDYQIDNERLRIELESLRLQIKESTNAHNKQFSDLSDELTRLKNEKGTLQKYVRELEQNNDDLERAYRISCGSLADFEDRLNKAIEKNAILENELEERESMVVTVQRLKEEARDLRQDLEVKEVTIQQSRKSQVDEALVTSMIEEQTSEPPVNYSIQSTQTDISTTLSNHNSDMLDMIGQQNGPLRTSSPIHMPSMNHSSLSPSSKVSALHLVSEMLKKVGQIENKLVLTPNIQPTDTTSHKPCGGDSSNPNDGGGGPNNVRQDAQPSTSANQTPNKNPANNSSSRASKTSANQSQQTNLTPTKPKINGYHGNNKTNHFISSSKSTQSQLTSNTTPPSTHCAQPSPSCRQLNGYERSPKQATRASIQ